ncbi:hypothetical protein [Streptomyces hyaluromycini]|uniref:hypothetical protein n=1 Tax=Streptomyces hyaluromycini TaxID=1377993 RepID=UPI000B5C25EC|nr:hypothetical protein [Streptomyces hyaluromycini]
MTLPAASRPGVPAGAFADDEPVFTPACGLLPHVPVPVFGQRERWSGACLRRPSNVTPGNWRIAFPLFDPVWNLRAREMAFALLNPTHPELRAAGAFRPAQPAHLSTVRQLFERLGVLGRWALGQDLPGQLPLWDTGILTAFLTSRVSAGASGELSLGSYRSVLAVLHELRDVLTGGGLTVDPVAVEVAGTVPTTPTRPIAPAVWWPLLRAAWTYIDRFADDILTARDEVLARPAQPEPPTAAARHPIDECLERWLADPATRIPVHAAAFRISAAGTPMWSVISLLITDGANHTALDAGRREAAPRRRRILAEAARGRTLPLAPGQAQSLLGAQRIPTGTSPRPAAELDAALETWLSDPTHLVPVREDRIPAPHGPRTVRTPRWALLAPLVYGPNSPAGITAGTAAGRRRRSMVQAAVDAGQFQILAGQAHGSDLPRPTPHFTTVDRADGTTGPWRTHLSDRELGDELRALQGALYCFVAALTMMRDSEIQEIRRGALTLHYGTPAVRSYKLKNEPGPAEEKW